jgi:ribosomal protein S20
MLCTAITQKRVKRDKSYKSMLRTAITQKRDKSYKSMLCTAISEKR